MEKNEIVTVDITDMSSEGEGIGKVQGFPLFVKDTVIGDVCEVKLIKLKKNYGYGRLQRVITPSPDRVEARCPIARACGGCQLQNMTYEKQLEFKQKKVWNNLKRIGGLSVSLVDKSVDFYTKEWITSENDSENVDKNINSDVYKADSHQIPVFPTIGMEDPWHYRNKTQLPVGYDREGRLVAGFYAGRTHSIIPQETCYIANEASRELLEAVLSFMRLYSIVPYDEETHTGLVRHIYIRVGYHTGEKMVCLVINGKTLPHQEELVQTLQQIPGVVSICLNINRERTNVILGREMVNLYGPGYITDCIGDVRFHISPQSFFQVNPIQTEKLYAKALEFAGLTGGETVWDLYCGIGTISLFLAKHAASVRGVEIIPEAIENARENAALNGLTNTEFYVGKAEEVLPAIYEKEHCSADVIVVDPPRKGCDEALLSTIVQMQPKRVVYVSCDSATLARDLKWMAEHGYETRLVQPVDMFGQGGHVETVVLLSHKKPDGHINVKVEFGEGEGKVPLDSIAKRAEAYKPKERVTYKMIKEYIEAKYGFKVHTAYIAEVKRDLGLPMYDATNAVEELKQPRKHSTPEKVEAIKDALKYFGVCS